MSRRARAGRTSNWAFTTDRRLDAGPVVRAGTLAHYRSVVETDGEPHVVRSDLVDGVTAEHLRARGRGLACFAHVTDLHATDVQSPGRFEFVNKEYTDPRFHELLPMQRPQEALNAHAIEATVRALNRIGSGPISGRPLELVVMTGDAVDNAQSNELAAFIAMFDGGQVHPDSGGPRYEGVQASSWPDDMFWKPDGAGQSQDLFQSAFGYPQRPGLLERALQAFDATGLALPWLGCHGNHEELSQGVGVVTPELGDALVATCKPTGLPDGLDRNAALETFVNHPEAFMAGPAVQVTADPARRPFSRREFVEAHFGPRSRPLGHGFTADNRQDGTAYYAYDTATLRIITLDTACPAGGAAGCIDDGQLRWLEQRLEEVHSSYRSADGATIRTSHDDRLVVIASHHGLDSLTNARVHPGEDRSAYATPDQLLAVLRRFQNVVLWLNGHIHANAVHARRASGWTGGDFWEVTTGSIVDWPCQGRVIELIDAGSGVLAIVCTMFDHDGEVDPGPAVSSTDLAGLHRQLAGNAPFAGFQAGRAGTPMDQNVILALRAPFSLERLVGE